MCYYFQINFFVYLILNVKTSVWWGVFISKNNIINRGLKDAIKNSQLRKNQNPILFFKFKYNYKYNYKYSI